MNPTPLTVLALVQAKPGQEAVVRDLLTSMLAPTRLEAGCYHRIGEG